MATTYDRLDARLTAFIRRQKLFFVATAPLSAEGSVNGSPNSYDRLTVRVRRWRQEALRDLIR